MKNALLIFSIAVLVTVGCKLPDSLRGSQTNAPPSNTGSSSDPNQPSKSTNDGPWKAAPFTPSGNAHDDVINISNRFLAQKNFQAVMDGKGGTGVHMEVSYVAPDRFHISNSSSMESILIGKDTYVKTGGAWRKMPMDLSSTIAKMRDSFTDEELKNMSDVEYVGEDTAGGKDAYVYTFKGSRKDSATYVQKLWARKDDGLPIKVHIDYAGGVLKEITNTYTYDPNVTIEAPK